MGIGFSTSPRMTEGVLTGTRGKVKLLGDWDNELSSHGKALPGESNHNYVDRDVGPK